MRLESMPHSKVNQSSEASFDEAKIDPSPSVRPTDKPPNNKKKMSSSHRCWSWFHLTIYTGLPQKRIIHADWKKKSFKGFLNLAMR